MHIRDGEPRHNGDSSLKALNMDGNDETISILESEDFIEPPTCTNEDVTKDAGADDIVSVKEENPDCLDPYRTAKRPRNL
ncbi:hypothetical protein OROGR_030082 [Orobanche gracilis]